MPGGTEPLSEQLVMESTIWLSEGNPASGTPGAPGALNENVQSAGAGKLRKRVQVVCVVKI